MTKKFDDKARFQMVDSFKEKDFVFKDINVSDIEVREVTCKFARPYIASYHYSKTMPDSSKYICRVFGRESVWGRGVWNGY